MAAAFEEDGPRKENRELLIVFVAAVLVLNLGLAMGVRSAARGHTIMGLTSIVIASALLMFAAWLTAYSVGVLVLASTVATSSVALFAWKPWESAS